MTVKMYSSGHPYIPAGIGESDKEAIIAFVNNADVLQTQVRMIFNLTLGEDIVLYLENHTGSEAFNLLEKSGNYGQLHLERTFPDFLR